MTIDEAVRKTTREALLKWAHGRLSAAEYQTIADAITAEVLVRLAQAGVDVQAPANQQ